MATVPKRSGPSWQYVSFVPLPSWAKAAARCGFAIHPVLRELGITVSQESPSGVTVTVEQSNRLMVACTERARGHHFPFVFGEFLEVSAVPELATFLATAPTLRDGLRVYEWIRQLMSPSLGVTLYEEGDIAQLRIQIDRLATRSQATIYATEAVITWVLRETRTLLGIQHAKRLLFRHPAPANYRLYGQFFGTEAKFGQAHDAIELPRELINRKLNGSIPDLHQQSESRLKRIVGRLPTPASIGGQLESMYTNSRLSFCDGFAEVAASIGLPVRALQRRLQAENQSFAELQARARYRIARSLLQETSLGLEEISERLGFSDRRAFTRAFTKWSGQSPTAYRRHVPEGG